MTLKKRTDPSKRKNARFKKNLGEKAKLGLGRERKDDIGEAAQMMAATENRE